MAAATGNGTAEGFGAMAGDLFHENWRHEQRADGLYVIIEEIGGLGALGPFPDAEAARIGFARYFLGLDLAPPSAPVLQKAEDAPAPSRQPEGRRTPAVEIAHTSRPGTR